jgi:hypothetical protein
MPNYKTRSDDQIWWESQPGNRGKTYPGDDIASKQYERNKAAGENNASIARSIFGKLIGKRKSEAPVDLGQPDKDLSEYPTNDSGGVSLNAKGGKINLKDCKVSTHEKNSKHKHNW